MSKMGAPKKAILSLLIVGLLSIRLSSLLRLCCSCAVFADRGFHCFASLSCRVCAAIATVSRVSCFNDLICVSVGGCFPGRFETHRIDLLGFAVLAWTRAHVAARSFGRDEDMRAIFVGYDSHAKTCTLARHSSLVTRSMVLPSKFRNSSGRGSS